MTNAAVRVSSPLFRLSPSIKDSASRCSSPLSEGISHPRSFQTSMLSGREGTAELYKLVGTLNREHGITVVVIDHDLHAVLPYANRLVLMVDGEIRSDADVPTTLRYMYEHDIYVDALPSIFVTYLRLEAAGYTFPAPWLSVEAAKKGLTSVVH